LQQPLSAGRIRSSGPWSDLTSGRIGSGTLEYEVPLAGGAFRTGALAAENLSSKSEDNSGPALHVKDASRPGVLELRMASSYVYLGGRLFKHADSYVGPTQGKCKYTTVSDVPAGTREAQIRFRGEQRNTTCLFLVRIDADYREPHGGFRPVKVTYVWEEGGIEKRDIHVAAKPQVTYTIRCQSKPEMKSIVLELAE
jgi:hypothetical protein